MKKEMELQNGTLFYEIEAGEVAICGYHGIDATLILPDFIEGNPVTVIAKKAFMGQKHLIRVELPKTIKYIDDWAFAHCYMLREIAIYPNPISIGKGVFMECTKLAEANLLEEPDCIKNFPQDERKKIMESIPGLMMSTLTVLEASYLFQPQDAGETGWFIQYDNKMMMELNQDDMEGYTKTISCGEEDYGNTSQEQYISERRKGKVRLLLIRLLHEYGMKEDVRGCCEKYLREHMPGQESDETWQVVQNEYGENLACFELLCKIGCVTADNIEQLIQDLGQNNPEAKSFLMKYKQEKFSSNTEDFFAGFEL